MRPRRPRRSAAPLATAFALAGVLAASCAPPPPGSLESLEINARRGADRRERRLAGFEAEAAVRVDGRATGRLPAVSLHARLASPDRVRLQLRWLLGLLVDLAARGDTLTAWMPAERLGLRIPGIADTLGVREPARFLGRALTASWQAPHSAWRRGTLDSTGAVLAWPEGDESWTMTVDRAGRPREITVTHDGRSVAARYSDWRGAGSAAWPARIELADGEGWVRVRFDIEDVRAVKRARDAWFVLALPDDARRLELEDVKRVLSARGGSR